MKQEIDDDGPAADRLFAFAVRVSPLGRGKRKASSKIGLLLLRHLFHLLLQRASRDWVRGLTKGLSRDS
jgi:hypothetical protein